MRINSFVPCLHLLLLAISAVSGYPLLYSQDPRLGALRRFASPGTTDESFIAAVEKTSEDAARKAGNIIRSALGKINLDSGIKSKIGSRDIVTVVDKDAQDIIQKTIMEAFPSHTFLGTQGNVNIFDACDRWLSSYCSILVGEEDIAPGIDASSKATQTYSSAEHLWIVDPIDGTTNFAFGMPLSGVIIAYASKGLY